MIKRFLSWIGIQFIPDEIKCFRCELLGDSLDYERLKNIELLEFERSRNKEMLRALTELVNPTPIPIQDVSNLKPIFSRHTPFSQRRNQLERESAARAEEIKRSSPLAARSITEIKQPITMQAKTISELEQELSIEEN